MDNSIQTLEPVTARARIHGSALTGGKGAKTSATGASHNAGITLAKNAIA